MVDKQKIQETIAELGKNIGAYDKLSNADKDAVDNGIVEFVLTAAVKVALDPTSATPQELAYASVSDAVKSGITTTSTPTLTADAEAGLELLRENIASDPIFMGKARKIYRLQKESGQIEEPGTQTAIVNLMRDVDGDQFDLKSQLDGLRTPTGKER